MEKNPMERNPMIDSEWQAPKWVRDAKVTDPYLVALREGRGFDSLDIVAQAGITINKRLVADALDATSMGRAFALSDKDEEKIQQKTKELETIVERWGDPHS